MMYAAIIEAALNLLAVGIERGTIITKVHDMETKGATPKEIMDSLQNMRRVSERAAQDAISKLP